MEKEIKSINSETTFESLKISSYLKLGILLASCFINYAQAVPSLAHALDMAKYFIFDQKIRKLFLGPNYKFFRGLTLKETLETYFSDDNFDKKAIEKAIQKILPVNVKGLTISDLEQLHQTLKDYQISDSDVDGTILQKIAWKEYINLRLNLGDLANFILLLHLFSLSSSPLPTLRPSTNKLLENTGLSQVSEYVNRGANNIQEKVLNSSPFSIPSKDMSGLIPLSGDPKNLPKIEEYKLEGRGTAYFSQKKQVFGGIPQEIKENYNDLNASRAKYFLKKNPLKISTFTTSSSDKLRKRLLFEKNFNTFDQSNFEKEGLYLLFDVGLGRTSLRYPGQIYFPEEISELINTGNYEIRELSNPRFVEIFFKAKPGKDKEWVNYVNSSKNLDSAYLHPKKLNLTKAMLFKLGENKVFLPISLQNSNVVLYESKNGEYEIYNLYDLLRSANENHNAVVEILPDGTSLNFKDSSSARELANELLKLDLSYRYEVGIPVPYVRYLPESGDFGEYLDDDLVFNVKVTEQTNQQLLKDLPTVKTKNSQSVINITGKIGSSTIPRPVGFESISEPGSFVSSDALANTEFLENIPSEYSENLSDILESGLDYNFPKSLKESFSSWKKTLENAVDEDGEVTDLHKFESVLKEIRNYVNQAGYGENSELNQKLVYINLKEATNEDKKMMLQLEAIADAIENKEVFSCGTAAYFTQFILSALDIDNEVYFGYLNTNSDDKLTSDEKHAWNMVQYYDVIKKERVVKIFETTPSRKDNKVSKKDEDLTGSKFVIKESDLKNIMEMVKNNAMPIAIAVIVVFGLVSNMFGKIIVEKIKQMVPEDVNLVWDLLSAMLQNNIDAKTITKVVTSIVNLKYKFDSLQEKDRTTFFYLLSDILERNPTVYNSNKQSKKTYKEANYLLESLLKKSNHYLSQKSHQNIVLKKLIFGENHEKYGGEGFVKISTEKVFERKNLISEWLVSDDEDLNGLLSAQKRTQILELLEETLKLHDLVDIKPSPKPEAIS